MAGTSSSTSPPRNSKDDDQRRLDQGIPPGDIKPLTRSITKQSIDIDAPPSPSYDNGIFKNDQRLAETLGISSKQWSVMNDRAARLIEDDDDFIKMPLVSALSELKIESLARQMKNDYKHEILSERHGISDEVLMFFFTKVIKESGERAKRERSEAKNSLKTKGLDSASDGDDENDNGFESSKRYNSPRSPLTGDSPSIPNALESPRKRQHRPGVLDTEEDNAQDPVLDDGNTNKRAKNIPLSEEKTLNYRPPADLRETSAARELLNLSSGGRSRTDGFTTPPAGIVRNASHRSPLTFTVHPGLFSPEREPMILYDYVLHGKFTLAIFEEIWKKLESINGKSFDVLELTADGCQTFLIPQQNPQPQLRLFWSQECIKERITALEVLVKPMINDDYDFLSLTTPVSFSYTQ